MKPQQALAIGGLFSILIGLLHGAMIFAGPEAYIYFGAGKEMADGDAAGSILPDLLTLFIAVVFVGFGWYAFSGIGRVRRLPALKGVLIFIASIFLLRGLGVLFDVFSFFSTSDYPFRNIIFSLVSLVTGIFYGLGVYGLYFATHTKKP